MTKRAKKLLIQWVIQVMYMMTANYIAYSAIEREALANLTDDLVEEMKNETPTDCS